jgi:hypothetical protein
MHGWLANPGAEFVGYHTGGLLIWAAVLVPFLRTRKSLTTSVLISIAFGAVLGLLAYFTEHFAQEKDFAAIAGTGFAVGVTLYWVRYLAAQVLKFRAAISIIVNLVAFFPILIFAGYVRAATVAYNHAAEDYLKGLIKSAPLKGDELLRAIVAQHPDIGQQIVDEVRAAGFDFGDTSPTATDLSLSITISHIRSATRQAIRHGTDDAVNAAFAANLAILVELQQKDVAACARAVTTGLNQEEITALLGPSSTEKQNELLAAIVRSKKSAPSTVPENWVAVVQDNLTPEIASAIDSMTGSQEQIDCAREIVWRQAWHSFPAKPKSEVARAFLILMQSEP